MFSVVYVEIGETFETSARSPSSSVGRVKTASHGSSLENGQKGRRRSAPARSLARNSLRLLLEGTLDCCDHFRRLRSHVGLEAGDRIAVAVEEELGEVPLDLAAEFGVSGLVGEEDVERGLVVAGNGNLRHHGKANVVFV